MSMLVLAVLVGALLTLYLSVATVVAHRFTTARRFSPARPPAATGAPLPPGPSPSPLPRMRPPEPGRGPAPGCHFDQLALRIDHRVGRYRGVPGRHHPPALAHQPARIVGARALFTVGLRLAPRLRGGIRPGAARGEGQP